MHAHGFAGHVGVRTCSGRVGPPGEVKHCHASAPPSTLASPEDGITARDEGTHVPQHVICWGVREGEELHACVMRPGEDGAGEGREGGKGWQGMRRPSVQDSKTSRVHNADRNQKAG